MTDMEKDRRDMEKDRTDMEKYMTDMEKHRERLQGERELSIKNQILLGSQTMRLLYLSNAGALVALIGYIGNKGSGLLSSWKLSAICFIVGIFFSICICGCAYFYQSKMTTYITNLLTDAHNYLYLKEAGSHTTNSPPHWILNVGILWCGIGSFVFFISGACIIIFTLLTK